MLNQIQAAIISIAIIIPLSSIAIWNSAQSIPFLETTFHDEKIIAIASFFPLYDFTKMVGGEKVDVSLLIPFGIEPHDWEPTIQDLQRIQQADIVVINGLGFETWITDIVSANSEIKFVDTSTNISKIKIKQESIEKDGRDHESFSDPHIWLDPILAKNQIKNIENSLIKIDPQNKEFYSNNANSYSKQLDLLDKKIRNELSTCKKDFIAFHSAFSYFADHYGLNQHTVIKSNDPNVEATSKNLHEIINLARNQGIKVILTEEGVDSRNSEVIANEINGKVLVLSPLEIGDKDTNYLEKMEQYLSILNEGLCT
jgi:zinc transport system substrate-binding protein